MDRKRILVIDDEASLTHILKANLEETGQYAVRTENAGARAVAAALEFQPDLILLDVIMPDVDGATVAAQMREDDRLKHIPIVYLTAIVSQEEAHVHGGVIGGGTFVAKPVDTQELLRCVERYLGDDGSVSETARAPQRAPRVGLN